MNNLLIRYFLKKNYLLFCPKSHNFGGFHESLLWALKIKKNKQLKLIINFPFFSVHNHYRKISTKNFGKKIIFNYYKELSFKEKILSIIFTIFGNFFILISKFKIAELINLFFKKKVNKHHFPFLGFGLRDFQEKELFSENEIKNFWNTEIDLSNNNKNKTENRIVSLCVKDDNYSKYKDISKFALGNVNNFKTSINYLIEKGYNIHRVGDNTMNNFEYSHDNFYDFTKQKNHFSQMHDSIKTSDFYLGTSSSHGVIPNLYNKRKLVTNNIDFIQSGVSESYKNFGIFKKIFDVNKNKILSLEEVFFNENLFFINVNTLLKKKEIILIENSPNEILDSVKSFLNYDEKNFKISNQMSRYEDLRNQAIKYYKKKNIKNFYLSLYESSKISIPDNYLDLYLFDNKNLNDLSTEFVLVNKKMISS